MFRSSKLTDIVPCEPIELYNVLNHRRRGPRIAEINYLCLIDAREAEDYRRSHIITAINLKTDSEGSFLLPKYVEMDTFEHVVVYDTNTTSVQEPGRGIQCAQVLAAYSRNPVRILSGGFNRFDSMFSFLGTEKILYTPRELEDLEMYPLEVIAGLLYVGDQKQSMSPKILKDLGINAVVRLSQDGDALESVNGPQSLMNVSVSDSVRSDLFSSFERICSFIDSHISIGSRVLVVSQWGKSRCFAVAIAFLMHHLKYTLKEAWKHMLKCEPFMRPNTGFIQQLSDWERHTVGKKVTDISIY